MVSVFRSNTGVTMSATAPMALTRETAIIQYVINLLVPMEPAITRVRSVTTKLTAGTPLTKLTALQRSVLKENSNVAVESVSFEPMSVTTTMTVKITAMSTIATMTPAEATSSPAPMASALTRTGFVMEMMTARILVMRMDVKVTSVIIRVTQENGRVLGLDDASLLIKFVMEFQTVQKERMRTTPPVEDTVVRVSALS